MHVEIVVSVGGGDYRCELEDVKEGPAISLAFPLYRLDKSGTCDIEARVVVTWGACAGSGEFEHGSMRPDPEFLAE